MLQEGDGIPSDPEKGRMYLERACDSGILAACPRVKTSGKGGQGS
jgi:TPR repeat protein